MCDVRIVGKCGRCGGPMAVPRVVGMVGPVHPRCQSCEAVADPTAGLRTLPVLPDTGHTTWKDRARR